MFVSTVITFVQSKGCGCLE